jgi:hypothetical protein
MSLCDDQAFHLAGGTLKEIEVSKKSPAALDKLLQPLQNRPLHIVHAADEGLSGSAYHVGRPIVCLLAR